ncbi:C-5 cytosine-specific DNA methylase [Paenibacillus sp. FSL R7-269]|uniref:DNA cytosine methyltransferase n=1 Tax=Paenibacillus sp. FSL R7-269 TaxID=1226755 RepID=UPI0003E2370D|nr:DNA cytosine methyltransferase [Paenibacillus sp. FSL R7-269]ETT54798.1 C-5 cytosine-specific DNA methylase [Paenibacillus sp. FSL R7-269]
MEQINNIHYKTAAVLFGGIGGESAGLLRSKVEYGGKLYKFKLLCSIDSDPVACRNHDLITGEQTSVVMDLFQRWQYEAWHGHTPPAGWREMTPSDIWLAFREQVPFFLFLSPPCKGQSGLLPQDKAKSDKYQALNYLTVHGLEIALQACLEYGGSLPAIIQLENVPRITSRGKPLLKQIRKLLEKFNYAVSIRADHNLGEVGGLGQNRVRFLLMARQESQIPNVIYYPEPKPLKTIGEVIGPLPFPGDTVAGGPQNRMPNLARKSWEKLMAIPAGGDWRDLNDFEYQKYRLLHEPRSGAWAVEHWDQTSRTVTGGAGVGRSNGVAAISDPRLNLGEGTYSSIYRLVRWDEESPCVTGAAGVNNGALSVVDPRLSERDSRHPAAYRVVKDNEPAPCVTGTRFGSGAIAISDSRVNDREGRFTNQFKMQSWQEPAKTVTGDTDIQSGAQLIADPRCNAPLQPDCYGVQEWNRASKTIRGASRIMQSTSSIADPRLTCAPRADTMGVQKWSEPAKTVTGTADIHSGAAAVADPRIPEPDERCAMIIIAEDGTWHRPLTTFEMAMLQSFPQYLPDGRPFQLEGCSDAKAREYIGNAVPRDTAEEMGNVVLMAGAEAEAGIPFELSWNPVWVVPEVGTETILVH